MRPFRLSRPSIQKLEKKEHVKKLIKALQCNKANIRKEAVAVLGRIGNVRAIEPLIQALKDKNEETWQNAATALIKLGT